MKRLLGVDFGTKRLGLAMTDPLGLMAHPLVMVERSSKAGDIRRIREAIAGAELEAVVVGLPLNMDGSDGRLVEEVRSFAASLGKALGVPVEFIDERLTSWQAERMLTDEADMSRSKRRQVRDKLAACFILQSYLDRRAL